MNDDSKLIDDLGGPAKLAELLGYSKVDGGVQRVHNWRTRGIPSKVRLEHPEIFLRVATRLHQSAASEAT
jgi:hypothetical protein